MTNNSQSPKQLLIAALEKFDTSMRDERADRIIWMSSHNHRPSVIMGSSEVLGILAEVESAYREGHFISVILLAQALIEHELVDELVRRKVANYGDPLAKALQIARENQVLEDDIIERIDGLRHVRNPFAHLKKPDNAHTFGNRFRARKAHPKVVLKEDAQEAFKIMHDVFRALLRQAV